MINKCAPLPNSWGSTKGPTNGMEEIDILEIQQQHAATNPDEHPSRCRTKFLYETWELKCMSSGFSEEPTSVFHGHARNNENGTALDPPPPNNCTAAQQLPQPPSWGGRKPLPKAPGLRLSVPSGQGNQRLPPSGKVHVIMVISELFQGADPTLGLAGQDKQTHHLIITRRSSLPGPASAWHWVPHCYGHEVCEVNYSWRKGWRKPSQLIPHEKSNPKRCIGKCLFPARLLSSSRRTPPPPPPNCCRKL